MFVVSTLFSLVTLPVEFGVSARALKWLNNANKTTYIEHANAKDVLNLAVLIYAIAALSSIVMLLYYDIYK